MGCSYSKDRKCQFATLEELKEIINSLIERKKYLKKDSKDQNMNDDNEIINNKKKKSVNEYIKIIDKLSIEVEELEKNQDNNSINYTNNNNSNICNYNNSNIYNNNNNNSNIYNNNNNNNNIYNNIYKNIYNNNNNNINICNNNNIYNNNNNNIYNNNNIRNINNNNYNNFYNNIYSNNNNINNNNYNNFNNNNYNNNYSNNNNNNYNNNNDFNSNDNNNNNNNNYNNNNDFNNNNYNNNNNNNYNNNNDFNILIKFQTAAGTYKINANKKTKLFDAFEKALFNNEFKGERRTTNMGNITQLKNTSYSTTFYSEKDNYKKTKFLFGGEDVTENFSRNQPVSSLGKNLGSFISIIAILPVNTKNLLKTNYSNY